MVSRMVLRNEVSDAAMVDDCAGLEALWGKPRSRTRPRAYEFNEAFGADCEQCPDEIDGLVGGNVPPLCGARSLRDPDDGTNRPSGTPPRLH